MKTKHKIHFASATRLASLPSASVELVVTSPPYPMIEMWDPVFSEQDPAIATALEANESWTAFERMHALLAPVWKEVHRVLVPGGIACINVGDAVRTIGGTFSLYPNHARILVQLLELGFAPLPAILWRKQTNAPNKFMGSGMLPPGAYVTLEHEFVLIARKGDKRQFASGTAAANRKQSSFFWEERNNWYSDVWFDLKGTTQSLLERNVRERSGAFPFELPYRLISMFSVKGDTVLDPFIGTGTTMFAAMATARNSIGFELERNLAPVVEAQIDAALRLARNRTSERLCAHAEFVTNRRESKGPFGYRNLHYGFPVVTRQEIELLLNEPDFVRKAGEHEFEVEYLDSPRPEQLEDWSGFFGEEEARKDGVRRRRRRSASATGDAPVQLEWFGSTGSEPEASD